MFQRLTRVLLSQFIIKVKEILIILLVKSIIFNLKIIKQFNNIKHKILPILKKNKNVKIIVKKNLFQIQH